MSNIIDEKKITADALEEVSGGAASYGPPQAERSDTVLEPDALARSGAAVLEDRKANRTDEIVHDTNNPHQNPVLSGDMEYQERTIGVAGSKTAFESFFEKLWWNISKLFR